jgi:hypothetical protein
MLGFKKMARCSGVEGITPRGPPRPGCRVAVLLARDRQRDLAGVTLEANELDVPGRESDSPRSVGGEDWRE